MSDGPGGRIAVPPRRRRHEQPEAATKLDQQREQHAQDESHLAFAEALADQPTKTPDGIHTSASGVARGPPPPPLSIVSCRRERLLSSSQIKVQIYRSGTWAQLREWR